MRSPPVCLWLKRDLRVTDHPALATALKLLAAFLDARLQTYSRGMSSPVTAATSCSRLSAHLAFGTISIRRVWQASERLRLELGRHDADGVPNRNAPNQSTPARPNPRQRGLRAFQSRLHWHCHFIQKLEDEPALEFHSLQRSADTLRTAIPCPDRFALWQEGRTGYPLVDACMRSLVATGWLTFRMRALLVSFASCTLWLPWRPTGIFLARRFLDFEPGIHWPQMQMQSGTTGINTLRIYNPVKQALEQDPEGLFIRRWIPELARVPGGFIHEPWRMPAAVAAKAGVRIGLDYPSPLVDHMVALREAKARFQALRGSSQARSEAADVARRHGSRRDRRGAMRQDPVRRTLSRPPIPRPADPQLRLPFGD